jgi:2-dehydropantoate 2-reductase
MGNPVGAISGLGAEDMAANPKARALRIHIAKETTRVGLALNYGVEEVAGFDAEVWAKADQGDVYEELEASLLPKPGSVNWHSSMAQDVKKGRLSEIDHMNGYVVGKGREAGVDTPVSAAIVDMMHEIDAQRVGQDPANLDRVLKAAGLG